MAEKLYSRFILCFSNVSFLLLGFTIFGKFTTRAEFQSITRSGNKTVDETRDPMGRLKESPFRNGPWIPEWAHLLQQSVLEQSFYFSYISWMDSKTRKIHFEIISLKFRFESRQTLFGLILYGFIKRMDGYDPSPRFKIQYCLVYILIPIHYFAVLSIL